MNRICTLIIASFFSTFAFSKPLLTVTCNEPKGSSMGYGVPWFERTKAALDKKPIPTESHFQQEAKDGYDRKPAFIIDSSKRKVTITWAESADEQELRKQAKSENLPFSPTPSATEANIVLFTPNQISILEADFSGSVFLYSLFPKLGTAFIASQYTEPGGKNGRQVSTFAECEFSWSH